MFKVKKITENPTFSSKMQFLKPMGSAKIYPQRFQIQFVKKIGATA
jgi:hypothetical protein